MDIVYASNGTAGGGLGAFLPLIIIGLLPAFLFKSIAKRKGKSQWGWFLLGFIPIWGWLAGIWLASLPDKAILEEVGALVTELQKFDFVPKASEPSKQSYVPETWQCNCGKTNSMDEANCPDCGLKRDYVLSKQTVA